MRSLPATVASNVACHLPLGWCVPRLAMNSRSDASVDVTDAGCDVLSPTVVTRTDCRFGRIKDDPSRAVAPAEDVARSIAEGHSARARYHVFDQRSRRASPYTPPGRSKSACCSTPPALCPERTPSTTTPFADGLPSNNAAPLPLFPS